MRSPFHSYVKQLRIFINLHFDTMRFFFDTTCKLFFDAAVLVDLLFSFSSYIDQVLREHSISINNPIMKPNQTTTIVANHSPVFSYTHQRSQQCNSFGQAPFYLVVTNLQSATSERLCISGTRNIHYLDELPFSVSFPTINSTVAKCCRTMYLNYNRSNESCSTLPLIVQPEKCSQIVLMLQEFVASLRIPPWCNNKYFWKYWADITHVEFEFIAHFLDFIPCHSNQLAYFFEPARERSFKQFLFSCNKFKTVIIKFA
jgi:hypothetical protein